MVDDNIVPKLGTQIVFATIVPYFFDIFMANKVFDPYEELYVALVTEMPDRNNVTYFNELAHTECQGEGYSRKRYDSPLEWVAMRAGNPIAAVTFLSNERLVSFIVVNAREGQDVLIHFPDPLIDMQV